MSARRKKPKRARPVKLWALVGRDSGSIVWAYMRTTRAELRSWCGNNYLTYRIARVEIREIKRKGKRT